MLACPSTTRASVRPRNPALLRQTGSNSHKASLCSSRGRGISLVASPTLDELPRLQRSIATQAVPMDSLVSKGQDVVTALASMPTVWPLIGAVGCCALAIMYAFWDAWRLTAPPELSYAHTKFNDAVMSRMPALRRPFKPLPGLTIGSGHVETIWAAKTRTKINVTYRREVLHMPDGGIVSLDWRVPRAGEKALPDDAPVLILLPGLTGGSDDSYVRYASHYAETHGTRAVVFNSRGCGDTFVTTPRYYSGLYIGDMQRVVQAVRVRYPRSLLFSAGWSLGANILTNYLGLVGEDTPLDAAAVMCNPFDLVLGSHNLKKGFNHIGSFAAVDAPFRSSDEIFPNPRILTLFKYFTLGIYSKNLGSGMSKLMRRNLKVWNGVGDEFDVATACNAPSVRAWDHAITRVSFGFKTVDDYYKAASSAQRVGNVKIPLLVIQAADDPIAPIAGTPTQALKDNPNCILAVTKTGGHLGWVSDVGGYVGEPWTDSIIIEWLLSVQLQLSRDAANNLEGRNGSRLPTTTPLPAVPPSYSKAAPVSLQPSVRNCELSMQRTPLLTVDSGSGASIGGPSAASAGSKRKCTAIYDPISGLPTEKPDGDNLSPSQTGYFGPGESPRTQPGIPAVALNGAMKSRPVAAGDRPAVVNGTENRSFPLPVVSELTPDASEMSLGVLEAAQSSKTVGDLTNDASVRDTYPSGGSNGAGAAVDESMVSPPVLTNSNTQTSANGSDELSTPVLKGQLDITEARQGPGEVTSPFSSTSDLPAQPAAPMLGAAQHAASTPRFGGSASTSKPHVHQPRFFTMTQGRGLLEVTPDSAENTAVTPPRLGVDISQPRPGARVRGEVPSEMRSVNGTGKSNWVESSPQRLAGVAATLTMMCEAVCSKRSSSSSSEATAGDFCTPGVTCLSSLKSVDTEILAALGESVSQALQQESKRNSSNGNRFKGEQQTLSAPVGLQEGSDEVPDVVLEASSEADVQKKLNVLSALRLSSSGASGAASDGTPPAETATRAPVAAAHASSSFTAGTKGTMGVAAGQGISVSVSNAAWSASQVRVTDSARDSTSITRATAAKDRAGGTASSVRRTVWWNRTD